MWFLWFWGGVLRPVYTTDVGDSFIAASSIRWQQPGGLSKSIIMNNMRAYSIIDGILSTETVTSIENCVQACLRKNDCHTLEMKTNLSADNCVLYGGFGADLYLEPAIPNSLFYTVYGFPAVDLDGCS